MMKPRVWKHPTKDFWCVSYGPNNLFTLPYLTWPQAIEWANEKALLQAAKEPTC